MPADERRQHRRLDIRLPLECRRVDDAQGNALRTVTLNVSTGGVRFETDAEELEPGTLLHLELTVPPGDGHWPWQGRVSAVGEVVRIAPTRANGLQDPVSRRVTVAARFRDPLKLSF
jgi:hypothetical protein